jgi:hypothetical protein
VRQRLTLRSGSVGISVRASPQMIVPALGWRMNKTYHLISVLFGFRRVERAGTGHKAETRCTYSDLSKSRYIYCFQSLSVTQTSSDGRLSSVVVIGSARPAQPETSKKYLPNSGRTAHSAGSRGSPASEHEGIRLSGGRGRLAGIVGKCGGTYGDEC